MYLIFLSLLFQVKILAQHNTSGPTRSNNISQGITEQTLTQKIITGVPAYTWRHGCGPTALGMVIGYYDNYGFPELIYGNANIQNDIVNSFIANEMHYQDYSLPLDSYGNIIPDKSTLGGAHDDNCLADYMLTSRSSYGLTYGESYCALILTAFKKHLSSVYKNNSDYFIISNDVYTWCDNSFDLYKNEIDQNRPVILFVDTNGNGGEDHFVTGIGYDDITKMYGIYDTWDKNIHWYLWRPIGSGIRWGIDRFVTYSINKSPICWENNKSTLEGNLSSITFFNDKFGFIGANSQIYRTTNSGLSWQKTNPGIWGSVKKIIILDSLNIWALSEFSVINSTNGGLSWNTLLQEWGIDYFNAIKIFDKNSLVILKNGKVLKSLNGGNTWQYIDVPELIDISNVFFIDNNNGWAVGYNGKLFSTNNGGINWTIHDSKTKNWFRDVYFRNKNEGWIIGQNSFLFTIDGGKNWVLDSRSPLLLLNQLVFKDNYGLIIGENGVVLVSTDFGKTWLIQNSGVSNNLLACRINNSNSMFIVGSDGVLLNNNSFLVTVKDEVPLNYSLLQNYPNPFNPVTKIKFTIPKSEQVQIKIFDILGREIITLIDEVKYPGEYEVLFDGSKISSGIYFIRFLSNSHSHTIKSILLK